MHSYQHEVISPPPFPLTVDSIQRVSALFKAGNYLSFDNYILRAKSEHLSVSPSAGSWTSELATAVKDAMRSVNRHTGTSRQSRPLPLRTIVGLKVGTDPLVPDGPIAAVDMCIAGTMLLLREVELSAALLSHVSFPTEASVCWVLPASKTDCKAVGTVRTWDCICCSPTFAPLCPVHALRRQCSRLRSSFPNLASSVDFPLFPRQRAAKPPKLQWSTPYSNWFVCADLTSSIR